MAVTSGSQIFQFVGDTAAGQNVALDASYKLDDVKRAVGMAMHVGQPEGLSFHTSSDGLKELLSVSDIIAAAPPVSVLVDGRPVQAPQGPTGLPAVGSFYEIYPDHLGNHYRLFRKYGHVIETNVMGKRSFLTDSPEVSRVVLMESMYFTKYISEDHPLWGVKDNTTIFAGDTETENWRLAHKFLPPAMGPKAVRHYTPMIQAEGRSSFAVFDELADRGEAWNSYSYMTKLAAQAVGKFSLGADFGHFTSVDAKGHPLLKGFGDMLGLNKKVSMRGAWYRNLPFGIPAELNRARKEVYSELQRAIDASTSAGIRDLQMEEAATKASCVSDYLVNAVDEEGKHFPPGLLLGNMMVVMGAGFTTTSALLSWLTYSLVTYAGAQERLLQDLVDHDVDGVSDWTPEKAHGIPYLNNFLRETQRMHSPSYQPARTAKTDVILPGGYRVSAGSVVVAAIHGVHMNPEVWRDPQIFDPDRWEREETKNLSRYAFLPFAAGPRGCIGFNFALLEVKVLLSELVYRYEFVRDGNDAIEYDPEHQLYLPVNLYLTARRRTSWPAKSK